MFAAKMATLKHGTNQHEDQRIRSSSPTAVQAAARLGVGTTAVAVAKALRRAAAPEVVEAVERGHLTLHAAGQVDRAAEAG